MGNEQTRIVLLGKTGSGKSSTGNTILGAKRFATSRLGLSCTERSSGGHAVRFNEKIMVVDTPGTFHMKTEINELEKEIYKSLELTFPGPHVFIVVLGISRFTEEDQNSLEYLVHLFGENIYKHIIILFTRKDDLDCEGVSLNDYLKTAPVGLQSFINKCGGRTIAFNNCENAATKNSQVKDLLTMIRKNKENNDGKLYINTVIY